LASGSNIPTKEWVSEHWGLTADLAMVMVQSEMT
jgi:hypothetical protein